MTQFALIPSRPLHDVRTILLTVPLLDPAALSALTEALDAVEARERAMHSLLIECYGVIQGDVQFNEKPADHPHAVLAERVLAAACGRPAEAFRKVPASEVFALPQAVQIHQEHAHA